MLVRSTLISASIIGSCTHALVNCNLATNAANLAEFMAAENVSLETVWNAQPGKNMELTLDSKAIAELFLPADLDKLRVKPGELEKLMESPSQTNRIRLYAMVSALTDAQITPVFTALRAMKQNRRD
ncbi:MAG: hypothetical protein PHI85_01035 [Victivallaceae bacterium]|nr:hypothetical protein [Victivallaceae bacterium]